MASHATPHVQKIAITGGIGSGKSYICSQLAEAGYSIFYCDDEAKRIIRTDAAVRQELTKIVGPELYDADGKLVKSVLAAWLCRGKAYSQQIDAIVHPRVAQAFLQRAEEMQQSITSDRQQAHPPYTLPQQVTLPTLLHLHKQQTLFMECALLFESGFDRLVEQSVLVHVSHATQLKRLMSRDNLSQEKAEAWIALQLSEEEKMKRATSILDNERDL